MKSIKEYAIKCFKDESEAVLNLIPLLTDDFDNAVKLISQCKGKVVITGVGKSGHCGAKIAATLSSTGTPSFFMNTLDAFHGDLGMITSEDIVLAISYSGQTDELLRCLPYLREHQVKTISMTGNPSSLLAKNSDYHLNIDVNHEACPLNLAPTSSTTATLAMGDALACALMQIRHFSAKDFAGFHPGGTLGKRLLTKVKDMMRTEDLPIISPDTSISDALFSISKGRLCIAIILKNENLVGIVSDGDIRRCIGKFKESSLKMPVKEIMNVYPLNIKENEKLIVAENIFKEHNIHTLIVTNESEQVTGVLESYKCINS